jgi:serine/threonine protein phosphatase PrpC
MDSTGGKVKASFEKAFQTTSDQMVKELLNESGSTAVAALFQGKNLHISNCGDTRAILGQQAEGAHRLVPVELSR